MQSYPAQGCGAVVFLPVACPTPFPPPPRQQDFLQGDLNSLPLPLQAPGPPASLPFELAPGSQLPVLPSSSHHFDAAPTRSLSLLSAPALNSQASGQLAQAPALPMALPSLQGLEDSSEAQAFAKEAAQLQKFAQNLKVGGMHCFK